MEVIGREKQKRDLKYLIKSPKSELVAVYGRRRIGKTYLIRNVYKDDISLEFYGLHNGDDYDQLNNFKNQIINRNKTLDNNKELKNWQEAFSLLEKYINGLKRAKKKIIFIDEFPWFDTPKSKFLMWFENFWNTYCTKRNDIIVVICGSAASYMVKNIIQNKGGLHNRVTHKIRLLPFDLHETSLFLKSKHIRVEPYDILQLYMAIGGVPYYLDKIKRGMSVTQNIDELFFENDAELANEFDEVFSSLFSNSNTHIAIIKALAKVRKGISRSKLLQQCDLKSSGFTSRVITELMESGFVSEYTGFGKKKREALLRLSDEFSTFYLKFIDGNKNQGSGTWKQLSTKQSYRSWSGFAFESICLKHTQQIKSALGVAKVFSTNSSWHNKDAQIDLIINRDDNTINLCEMKFHGGPFSIDKKYYENLRNKETAFKDKTKTRKNTNTIMISTFGIIDNSYSLSIIENSITMDALFQAKDS